MDYTCFLCLYNCLPGILFNNLHIWYSDNAGTFLYKLYIKYMYNIVNIWTVSFKGFWIFKIIMVYFLNYPLKVWNSISTLRLYAFIYMCVNKRKYGDIIYRMMLQTTWWSCQDLHNQIKNNSSVSGVED